MQSHHRMETVKGVSLMYGQQQAMLQQLLEAEEQEMFAQSSYAFQPQLSAPVGFESDGLVDTGGFAFRREVSEPASMMPYYNVASPNALALTPQQQGMPFYYVAVPIQMGGSSAGSSNQGACFQPFEQKPGFNVDKTQFKDEQHGGKLRLGRHEWEQSQSGSDCTDDSGSKPQSQGSTQLPSSSGGGGQSDSSGTPHPHQVPSWGVSSSNNMGYTSQPTASKAIRSGPASAPAVRTRGCRGRGRGRLFDEDFDNPSSLTEECHSEVTGTYQESYSEVTPSHQDEDDQTRKRRARVDPVSWDSGVLTVMIRQIARPLTQLLMLQEVNRRGFAGTYDFLYLPFDLKKGINVGYGFISFMHPKHALEFKAAFDGSSLSGDGKKSKGLKTLRVHPAAVQGYARNLQHFMGTKTGQKQDPQLCPLFFPGGVPMGLAAEMALALVSQDRSAATISRVGGTMPQAVFDGSIYSCDGKQSQGYARNVQHFMGTKTGQKQDPQLSSVSCPGGVPVGFSAETARAALPHRCVSVEQQLSDSDLRLRQEQALSSIMRQSFATSEHQLHQELSAATMTRVGGTMPQDPRENLRVQLKQLKDAQEQQQAQMDMLRTLMMGVRQT